VERIKQALERARIERLNREGGHDVVELASSPKRIDAPHTEPSARLVPRTQEVFWPSLNARRVVGGPEASALVDTYRVLRTQVLQRMTNAKMRTLGITSANPGEGKSLTAANLAISLAKKVPVLLVDADLRRPSIRQLFDLGPPTGLAEYLTGDNDIEECIFNPGIDMLNILPGGAPCINSSELLVSPKMLELVEALKRSDASRLIIFDLPPLLTADDALAFSPHVEAALLVVEEGKTTAAELERATELLQGTHLLGSVLNKSTQTHAAYYSYN